MATVKVDSKLDVPLDKAWPVFSNFGLFGAWALGGLVPVEVTGQGIGVTRRMDLPGMGTVAERLDAIDHTNHTLTYTLVEGHPLGMAQYQCKAAMTSTGSTSCTLHWEGTFTPAAGMDEEEMKKNVAASYEGMAASLEAYVKAA